MDIVSAAFETWSKGDGVFFEILADDVSWTVTGSNPAAGTYSSREEFMEGAIRPISALLSEPIRPAVERIIAEGRHGCRVVERPCRRKGRSAIRQPVLLDLAGGQLTAYKKR